MYIFFLFFFLHILVLNYFISHIITYNLRDDTRRWCKRVNCYHCNDWWIYGNVNNTIISYSSFLIQRDIVNSYDILLASLDLFLLKCYNAYIIISTCTARSSLYVIFLRVCNMPMSVTFCIIRGYNFSLFYRMKSY